MPATTIRVSSDDPVPVRIQNVEVHFYVAAGGAFVTQGTTDVNGEVTVMIPDGDYDLLFYKQGVSILPRQPQRIEVDSLLTNTFLVTGHVRTLPEAIDPLRCRVSGYLRGINGQAVKDVKLTFATVLDVIVLLENIISPQHRVLVSPDDNGYFEFDLLRGVDYEAFFTGIETIAGQKPARLDVKVPALPAVGLEKLLFPLPVLVTLSDETKTLPVGTIDESVTFTVAFTDNSARKTSIWATLTAKSSDPDVVGVALMGDKVVLSPMAAGSATVTFERKLPSSILFNPEPAFVADELDVTVS